LTFYLTIVELLLALRTPPTLRIALRMPRKFSIDMTNPLFSLHFHGLTVACNALFLLTKGGSRPATCKSLI
jgi:hypothetical protein